MSCSCREGSSAPDRRSPRRRRVQPVEGTGPLGPPPSVGGGGSGSGPRTAITDAALVAGQVHERRVTPLGYSSQAKSLDHIAGILSSSKDV